jgi:AraC family transcriptional regulator
LGKIATRILSRGDGWSVSDVVCTSGPSDRPFEEQHTAAAVAVVVEGSFQYRGRRGTELMSAGSLLVNDYGQSFECAHHYGSGDRCLALQFTPEFLDRAEVRGGFPVHRIPPIKEMARWIVDAQLAIKSPEKVALKELAYGLLGSVCDVLAEKRETRRPPSAADERRITQALRYIEASLGAELSLPRLAAFARMSEFHFLRVFKQVTGVTPHQYIVRARLRQAALRLRSDSAPVLDIALDSGFRDLSNFNHAFRAEFGTNPAKYRDRKPRALDSAPGNRSSGSIEWTSPLD